MKLASRFLASVILPLLLLLGFFCAPAPAQAQTANKGGISAYAAGGLLFGMASYRIGYGDWEIGRLNSQTVGFDQVFNFSGSYYASFGVGFLLSSLSVFSQPGLYAGVGYEPRLFWKLYLRAEASASASFTGQTAGELLLGLSAHFD